MKPRTGEQVIWSWVIVAALVAGAWYGLPRYLGTLEARIVFADPDCMQVTVDRVVEAGLDLQERVDSTAAWTVDCLEDRQAVVMRRAALVGWSANVAIGIGAMIALLVTGGWVSALRTGRGRAEDA